MAIYTNVVQEFRDQIEARLTLNDVIDSLISQKLVDEKLYTEIWGHPNNRVGWLLVIILKDGKRCSKFIDILGTIPHMKSIFEAIRSTIDKIYKMIVIGGFPEFSLNYVVRNSVEWIKLATKIKDKALELDPKNCSTLVVHGLPGFGKSSLVNQVLQTKTFLEVSGGAMFWINLGEHSDTTAIVNPLWNLYLTAVKVTNQVALPMRPEDIYILQNEVKRVFLDDRLSNSYIILDDVKSSEVLNTFKIRCKTIVTTQDKNVANAFEALFIKVTTGFTKKESLELLRKSLDTDNLCSKESFANKIHEQCDGCPMLLNIIGSILRDSREEALSTDIIWDSIIGEITKNDYLPESVLDYPTTMKVIQMIKRFVTRLSAEVQNCFHSLAVFPKHVNIRPEILMKLWDKSYCEVRQIMVELENKSLIVSFYNKDLKAYIYSIHSLVRTYLIGRSHIDIKFYHKKLILKCEDVITKSAPDDPVANYIFGYYGYHAKNAELYDKFEKYFDLKFIENKIKRVGSADLLTDFETYKDLITNNELYLEEKLEDYILFVNLYSAHLHISPETNIVQFAFFNDDNCVYEEARAIAKNNPDELYFKLESYSDLHKNFPVLKTKSSPLSSCFLDSKEVLVGTNSGSIEIKSFHQYQNKVQRFEGHSDQVFSLSLSPDNRSFLSISLDHTAKLWRFAEKLDPQSPKLKQTDWKNLHSPDENIEPYRTFKLQDGDYITSAAFPYDFSDEIVTASQAGKISRWDVKTATVIKETAFGLPIAQICYAHDSQQILFSYNGKVHNHLRANLTYNGQFSTLDEINFLLLIPTVKEVAVISTQKFEIWNYTNKLRRFFFETGSNITAAVVNGEFLGVGTSDYIYLVDYKVQSVLHYKNDFGRPSSLYLLPDRIAFISVDNDSVQRYEFCRESSEKPLVHDLALFNCYWKESLPIYFIVNAENKIDIFNGHSTILAGITITDKITSATFSLCGNYLILGTRTGKVCFYNFKTRKMRETKICSEEIVLIKCFESEVDQHSDYNTLCGVVVAASKSKVVIIDSTIELKTSNCVSNILYLSGKFIIVDVDGKLSIAVIVNKELVSWVAIQFENVVVVATHKEKNYFGAACKDVEDYVVRIYVMTSSLDLKELVFQERFYTKPECMSFSASAKILAIGCEDGDIKIFNLQTHNQAVLSLHKMSVEMLLFATNFETILVSLGEQIAWWNLESFESLSEKKNLNGKANLDIVSHKFAQLFTFDPWKNKKLHSTVPYLLTSTNLNCKQLQYISASKDFRFFLVVDINGNIFKMDIISS